MASAEEQVILAECNFFAPRHPSFGEGAKRQEFIDGEI